jgi:hypothetical protein
MSHDNLLPLAAHRSQAVNRRKEHVIGTPVVQHGLASTDRVYISIMDKSEHSMFAHLRARLLKELAPEGTLESMLVEHIAVSHFRLLRVFAIDHALAGTAVRQYQKTGALHTIEHDLQRLQRLAEYERQIERTFRLSIQQLQKLQEVRRLGKNESSRTEPAA